MAAADVEVIVEVDTSPITTVLHFYIITLTTYTTKLWCRLQC